MTTKLSKEQIQEISKHLFKENNLFSLEAFNELRSLSAEEIIERTHNRVIEAILPIIEAQYEMIVSLKESNNFYANPDNWEQPEIRGYTALRAEKIIDRDVTKTDDQIFTGGERARECKRKLAEILTRFPELKDELGE